MKTVNVTKKVKKNVICTLTCPGGTGDVLEVGVRCGEGGGGLSGADDRQTDVNVVVHAHHKADRCRPLTHQHRGRREGHHVRGRCHRNHTTFC
jgi:hypothetical protein